MSKSAIVNIEINRNIIQKEEDLSIRERFLLLMGPFNHGFTVLIRYDMLNRHLDMLMSHLDILMRFVNMLVRHLDMLMRYLDMPMRQMDMPMSHLDMHISCES